MSQYKITHDEAYIIAQALYDWNPNFHYDDKLKALQAARAIEQLRKFMDMQSIDGRRSGRRSVVSLTSSIERLYFRYFCS
jgi:hypothetical protein